MSPGGIPESRQIATPRGKNPTQEILGRSPGFPASCRELRHIRASWMYAMLPMESGSLPRPGLSGMSPVRSPYSLFPALPPHPPLYPRGVYFYPTPSCKSIRMNSLRITPIN
jgi:hypothetical protein